MTFTKEQIKLAYKNLSSEIQNFIMDNETTELIENNLKEVGLSEEQSVSADSEILYAMYGLQTSSEAMLNIAKLSNKNINELSQLKNNLENNIFSKIQINKNLSANKIDLDTRIEEISKKYNLNDTQKNSLNSICKEILFDMDKKETLLSDIDQKLSVSKLLAEQIINDLNKRVFEYAISTLEKKGQNVCPLGKECQGFYQDGQRACNCR